MTQLVCPLCGRHLSLANYDPSSYDDDVYGVEVTGLGRGKGFAITEKYSLLDDEHLRGLITQRCRRIIFFIEGVEPSLPGVLAKLQKSNKDWSVWGSGVKNTMAQKDAEITRLRNLHSAEVRISNSWRHESSAQAARIEELERTNNQWLVAYNNVKKARDAKDKMIHELRAENQKLRGKVNALEEVSEDEDSAAAAEMEELLERINDSSNTDFDSLDDAVNWLLEG